MARPPGRPGLTVLAQVLRFRGIPVFTKNRRGGPGNASSLRSGVAPPTPLQ
ncbi:hypothetical protein CSB86_5416 [Pseudomonas aeruginosa]|nr:hypothetical protein CSB86_5416 [Pseudomonas aeruginosa]